MYKLSYWLKREKVKQRQNPAPKISSPKMSQRLNNRYRNISALKRFGAKVSALKWCSPVIYVGVLAHAKNSNVSRHTEFCFLLLVTPLKGSHLNWKLLLKCSKWNFISSYYYHLYWLWYLGHTFLDFVFIIQNANRVFKLIQAIQLW